MSKPFTECGGDIERPNQGAFEERLRSWMASSERRFEANMAANGDVLELTMLDIVGEDWWTGGGITSKRVQEKLAANPKAKTIKILLNSPGGDAFEGLAIQALLKRHGARIEIEIVGLAASAASVIAMAGDEIAMHEGSLFMVHEPWTWAVGDASEMRTTAEFLDKVNASALDVYERRTGRSRVELAALVGAETWMTAHEAVKEKFATNVVEGAAPEPATKARAAAQAFMTTRRPPRQQPRQVPPAPAPDPTPPAPEARQTNPGSGEEQRNMALSKLIITALSLAEDADENAAVAAITKLKTSASVGTQIEQLLGAAGPAALGAVRALQEERNNNTQLASEVAKLKIVNARREFDGLREQGTKALKLTPAVSKLYNDRFEAAIKLSEGENGDADSAAAKAAEVCADFKGYLAVAPRIVSTASAPAADGGVGGDGAPILFEGKKFEELKPMQQKRLKDNNPDLYNSMREDAQARGAI
jgi:ATP-dependent Clp protease, protease subunit